MPVPTITEPESPRIISVGQAFSVQLSASESPTSWAASPLPTGLSINSSGLISGTPTAEGWSAASITATNGSGDSDAVSLGILVLAAATGVSANTLGRDLDFDLITGKLSVDGIADPQPSGMPPGAAEDGAPILTFKEGDRYPLLIGLKNRGVLQEITGVSNVYATLKNADAEDEAGISLEIDSTDFTVTGADTTARYSLPCYFDPDGLATWLLDNELNAADEVAGSQQTWFDGLLEVAVEIADDDREFTNSQTAAIASIDQGDTHNQTFVLNLDGKTFTANATTDVITVTGHGYANEDTVRLYTYTGTLPTGLSAGTTYYVRDVTTDTFKLETSIGGGAVNFTTNGTGTLYVLKLGTPVDVADYTITMGVVFPSDSSLDVTLTTRVRVTWSGTAYTFTDVSGSTSGTGTATGEGDWGVTFSRTAQTAVQIGALIGVRAVSAAQTIPTVVIDAVAHDASVTDNSPSADTLDQGGSGASLVFKDASVNTIGTLALSNGGSYTAAQLKTAIEAQISEALVSVTLDAGADEWTIEFADDTAVDEVYCSIGPDTWAVVMAADGPTYTDGYFTLDVAGLEIDDRGSTISSQSAPIRVVRRLKAS